MQKKRQMSNGYTRCYKQPGNQALVLAGIVLVGLGVVLLFLCIPGWAWVALLGFVLICAGLVKDANLYKSCDPAAYCTEDVIL